MAEQNRIKIVIAVNKKDVWFCRICVASIRYYYPETEIFLLKDELNGKFSTREIEKYWNVQLINLGESRFGWGASKTFFLLQAPPGEKFLVLDSDIVFIGPFLERLLQKVNANDIVVSADFLSNPSIEWVEKVYFNVAKVKEFDLTYFFPGYFFNTGQVFITGGCVTEADFEGLFMKKKFPYWLRLDLFPLVDQSVYNYLFPKLQLEGNLTISTDQFMLWSEADSGGELVLEKIIDKSYRMGLIHWAGAVRTPHLNKMKRADILVFFENYYYKRIRFSSFKKNARLLSYHYNHYSHRILTITSEKLFKKKY